MKVFAGLDAGFHFVDASHGVGQLECDARMPFVDLSKCLVVIVDNGWWALFVVILLEVIVVVFVVPLLRGVGFSLGLLFVQDFRNTGLAFSFSGLVLCREPFETTNVESFF